MPDVQHNMQRLLKEAKEKNPELAYRFIDSTPDIMRERLQSDEWKLAKRDGQEVRVGDLILACKPRKDIEEQKKREAEKNSRLIDSVTSQYYETINRHGAGGKYLAPLTPQQAGGFGKRHRD